MKIYNQKVELIFEPGSLGSIQSKSKGLADIAKKLKNAGIPVEDVSTKSAPLPPAKKGFKSALSKSAKAENLYVKTAIRDSEMNPWDVAHLSSKAVGPQASFVEPDILQEYTVTDANANAAFKRKNSKAMAKSADNGFDPDWPPSQNIIWHLEDNFSQLKSAREAVSDNNFTVRIAHIDTGYDSTHKIVPANAKQNILQRNFVEGEDMMDAHDPRTAGMLRMPGHGTGTIGILAGNKLKLKTDNGGFEDYIGGAPFADIICCRIAPSVILFKTSAFAEAVNYLVQLTLAGTPVHVVSMSMGGAPSKAWAKAVNAAYEAGITLVTASGNHFNGLPTKHVVYPARFKRVIAACGVTNTLSPYFSKKLGEMQGCYGPERHMDKALAAFTPNTPWATGNDSSISFAGAGTSSATPQVAAAAAIYYKKYHAELDALPGWQRVEAIRNALYGSALKSANPIGNFLSCFGNGIVKANDALKIGVKKITTKTPEDSVPWFPILATIFKSVPKPGSAIGSKMTMYNTELAQLVYYNQDLAKIIGDEEKPYEKVSKKEWASFRDAVIQHPDASKTLKSYLLTTKSIK